MPGSSHRQQRRQQHQRLLLLLSPTLLLLLNAAGRVECLARSSCFTFRGWRNPCVNVTCKSNARCVPTYSGKNYKCQCISKCWDVGDSDDSGEVCGDDGVDYPSACHLRRDSCNAAFMINIKYKGRCDPCRTHLCRPTERCVIDLERRPRCLCRDCLPAESRKTVCASDGKSYMGECEMNRVACRENLNLTKLHDGQCPPGRYCQKACPRPYSMCLVNPRTLRSECHCPQKCQDVYSPVCGTDNRVYDSICHLRRFACQRNRRVRPLMRGDCGLSGTCRIDSNHCPFGGVCRRRIVYSLPVKSYSLEHSCERPECILENDAPNLQSMSVCGTDNNTYKSECFMRQAAFDKKMEIQVQLRGYCDACGRHKCPYYGICQVDSLGKPWCSCNNYCVYVSSPVCGSDGVTYELECDLRTQACRNKKDVWVLHQGKCTAEDIRAIQERLKRQEVVNKESVESAVQNFWTEDFNSTVN